MGENGKFVMIDGRLVWVPDFSKQPINNDDAIDFIIKEEGFLEKPKDIGDGKITIGSGLTDPKWIELYKARGNKWSDEDNRMAVAEEVQKRREWNEENVPNWERLSPSAQNALLSYRYNYNYTRDNSPKLFKALEDFNLFEAAKQMDAVSGNSKFTKGLGDRREREQNLFLSDYNQEPSIFNTQPEVPVSTKVTTPYPTQLENTKRVPAGPYKDRYVVTESEKRRQQLRKAFKAKQDYDRIMETNNLQNTATPQFTSTSSLFDKGGLLEPKDAWDRLSIPEKADIIKVGVKHGIFDLQELRKKYNEFKEGGSKEEEEEVNTEKDYINTMERVAEENYRKRKHELGGNLFDGTSQSTQKMQIGKPYYSYDENGRKIDDTLNYNISFPEVVIIPDSKKSPAERNENERYRQKTQREYAEQKSRDYTERQIVSSQKEWENSLEKAILDYGQAAATGIGIGADMVSGLPIYSSLKGARVLSEAETPLDYIEGGLWLTPLFGEAYQTAKPMVTTAVNDIFTNHPALYQYPRYVMGKLKYGMDAELPTVFRKFSTLPKVENGKVVISNPNSRFAYDNGFGEQSPIITNFTTDAPVRSHSAGNWDRDLTLAFPGKKLLGKRVISTRPSDTFTFGDNITISTRDVTGFSGRQKELDYLWSNGMKSITSPEAEAFWESGASDLANKIAQARTTNAKIFQNRSKGIVLLKPKTPYGDFSNYANTIENLTRETFKSPTLKDYQFMDYVFKPRFTSEVTPKVENFTFDFINKNPMFGEWLGNSERRTYLDQPWRWGNLMYDPLTPVESEFRSELNIGLKPEFKR